MCVINIGYGMQEKIKDNEQTDSIFLRGSSCVLTTIQLAFKDIFCSTYQEEEPHREHFDKERLERMGKRANAIVSLDFEDNMDGENNKLFDTKWVARHEQLVGQICPKDDDEFWKH